MKHLNLLLPRAIPALSLMVLCNTASAMAIFTDRSDWERAVFGTITTDTFDNDIANHNRITLDSGITSISDTSNPSNQVFNGFWHGSKVADLG